MKQQVQKHTLANGLTVLVVHQGHIPKVSVQLWYKVGSKHEQSGEKGIAHLIEHMIFKGTDILSESDLNTITHKLSGYCNAFTSHDYTGYLFDFPTHHWHEALPIMADCMQHCSFKEQLLNSELKAVVQELKMYRDDYDSVLMERMMGTIFADHPYHYPVIGFKQDLWDVCRESLLTFYKHHYHPNNATLVVVGDVNAEEVYERAERAFGSIVADLTYSSPYFYHSTDIESTQTTIMRDVQQMQCMIAWEVPGIIARSDYILDVASWVIGSGKGSQLYQSIVDTQQLATDIESFTWDLFEHGLFWITFQPREGVEQQRVVNAIFNEINTLVQQGITKQQLRRAVRKTEIDIVGLQERPQKYAYLLGKTFLATGDEQYCVSYSAQLQDPRLEERVQELVATYMRPAVAHQGAIIPISAQERLYWTGHQERADREDERIITARIRDIPVEPPMYAPTVAVASPKPFNFPRPERYVLRNGLTVMYYHNPAIPTIDVAIDLLAKHYYDPEDRQGLSMFLADVMQEGTGRYTGAEFAQELEAYGMSLNVVPGHIALKMINADARKGLTLLADMLSNATCSTIAVEKVRQRMVADVRDFWDNPAQFVGHLIRREVYGAHPFHKAALGTIESITAITQQDIQNAYRAWITPQGSCIALVGDIRGYDVPLLLEETLGCWAGPVVPPIDFPQLAVPSVASVVTWDMNRDQVVLGLGRLSVQRFDADYDALMLFDQIFTGGSLTSMSSRLFELREQSGLFYTIGGSIVAGVGKQPGIAYFKTIVSPDRLQEAERSIKELIDKGASDMTDIELEEAKRATHATLVDAFATNRQTAASLLFLYEYELPDTYFETRMNQIFSIQRREVETAVERILRSREFSVVRVGRV